MIVLGNPLAGPVGAPTATNQRTEASTFPCPSQCAKDSIGFLFPLSQTNELTTCPVQSSQCGLQDCPSQLTKLQLHHPCPTLTARQSAALTDCADVIDVHSGKSLDNFRERSVNVLLRSQFQT